MLHAWTLLLLQSFALAKPAYNLTPVRPFWINAGVKPGAAYPPSSNLKISPWQVRFSRRGEIVTVGERVYTVGDGRFRNNSGCIETAGTGFNASNKIKFCLKDATGGTDGFSVNGETVGEDGVLALNAVDRIELKFRWADGRSIRWSLVAPSESAVDIVRTTLEKVAWQRLISGSNLKSGPYPRGAALETFEITSRTWMEREAGVDRVVLERLVTNPQEIPESDARLKLIEPRSFVGAYGAKLGFKTDQAGKTEQWTLENADYGARTVDLQSESGIWRTPVWRIPNNETKLRFSGFVGDTNFVTGEIDLLHFFDLFNSQDESTWATQKWSARIRGSSALVSTSGNVTPAVRVVSAGARYNLERALWNVDTSTGIEFGITNASVFTARQSYVHFGVFRAGPMPDVIDKFIGRLRVLAKANFYDLEAQGLMPASSEASLSWRLAVRAKSYLSEQVFVELGIALDDLSVSQIQSLRSAQGTAGIGLNF